MSEIYRFRLDSEYDPKVGDFAGADGSTLYFNSRVPSQLKKLDNGKWSNISHPDGYSYKVTSEYKSRPALRHNNFIMGEQKYFLLDTEEVVDISSLPGSGGVVLNCDWLASPTCFQNGNSYSFRAGVDNPGYWLQTDVIEYDDFGDPIGLEYHDTSDWTSLYLSGYKYLKPQYGGGLHTAPAYKNTWVVTHEDDDKIAVVNMAGEILKEFMYPGWIGDKQAFKITSDLTIIYYYRLTSTSNYEAYRILDTDSVFPVSYDNSGGFVDVIAGREFYSRSGLGLLKKTEDISDQVIDLGHSEADSISYEQSLRDGTDVYKVTYPGYVYKSVFVKYKSVVEEVDGTGPFFEIDGKYIQNKTVSDIDINVINNGVPETIPLPTSYYSSLGISVPSNATVLVIGNELFVFFQIWDSGSPHHGRYDLFKVEPDGYFHQATYLNASWRFFANFEDNLDLFSGLRAVSINGGTLTWLDSLDGTTLDEFKIDNMEDLSGKTLNDFYTQSLGFGLTNDQDKVLERGVVILYNTPTEDIEFSVITFSSPYSYQFKQFTIPAEYQSDFRCENILYWGYNYFIYKKYYSDLLLKANIGPGDEITSVENLGYALLSHDNWMGDYSSENLSMTEILWDAGESLYAPSINPIGDSDLSNNLASSLNNNPVFPGSSTGAYVGCSWNDYLDLLASYLDYLWGLNVPKSAGKGSISGIDTDDIEKDSSDLVDPIKLAGPIGPGKGIPYAGHDPSDGNKPKNRRRRRGDTDAGEDPIVDEPLWPGGDDPGHPDYPYLPGDQIAGNGDENSVPVENAGNKRLEKINPDLDQQEYDDVTPDIDDNADIPYHENEGNSETTTVESFPPGVNPNLPNGGIRITKRNQDGDSPGSNYQPRVDSDGKNSYETYIPNDTESTGVEFSLWAKKVGMRAQNEMIGIISEEDGTNLKKLYRITPDQTTLLGTFNGDDCMLSVNKLHIVYAYNTDSGDRKVCRYTGETNEQNEIVPEFFLTEEQLANKIAGITIQDNSVTAVTIDGVVINKLLPRAENFHSKGFDQRWSNFA